MERINDWIKLGVEEKSQFLLVVTGGPSITEYLRPMLQNRASTIDICNPDEYEPLSRRAKRKQSLIILVHYEIIQLREVLSRKDSFKVFANSKIVNLMQPDPNMFRYRAEAF